MIEVIMCKCNYSLDPSDWVIITMDMLGKGGAVGFNPQSLGHARKRRSGWL